MQSDKIIVRINMHRSNKIIDVEIPVNISCNELMVALNSAYGLDMDVSDISKCSLKCENPTVLLKGAHILKEYGLRNGSLIHIF